MYKYIDRRRVLLASGIGIVSSLTGCTELSDVTSTTSGEPTAAVETYLDGVAAGDTDTIADSYHGTLNQESIEAEIGVGLRTYGVGYDEVTHVSIHGIETVTLADFLAFRTGMDGAALETDVDEWEEGLPTYLEEIGADEYAFVSVVADIEVFGERETMEDYFFVVYVDGEWVVADMPREDEVKLYDVGMLVNSFEPSRLEVDVGTTVIWMNDSSRIHTVTATSVPEGADYFASGGYDSYAAAEQQYHDDRGGALTSGDRYSHTFDASGVYEYVSLPFGDEMTGQIVVD